jgi:uncharacterized cupredoxin-like copper-binding protein
VTLALPFLAASCSETTTPPDESQVDVVAVEYEFVGVSSQLPAGATTFVIRNDGGEGHDFIVGRMLREDVEVPEVLEIPQPERERSFRQVAETVIVHPGETARLSVDLAEGRYAYLCLTTTEAGRTHAYHGMWGEFSVA